MRYRAQKMHEKVPRERRGAGRAAEEVYHGQRVSRGTLPSSATGSRLIPLERNNRLAAVAAYETRASLTPRDIRGEKR